MNNVWFTSDIHFGHEKIIGYCNRPFRDADEMDEAIIERWNDVVHPSDRVFILGDVSFRTVGETVDIFNRLKGNKHLIVGNHDEKLVKHPSFTALFERVDYIRKIRSSGKRFILCHYPMLSWEGMQKGYFHLHGHCHGSLDPKFQGPRIIDVGMDAWAYMPVTMDEVLDAMKDKSFVQVDHHQQHT